MGVALANALFSPACGALMADLVPRAMAALGRGSIMLGSTAGGIGGPSLGFLMAVPLVIASCAAGLLYGAQPAYPWFASSVALL
ncbi:MAG: hypothetical protein JXA74_15890, partial [Anaerolineae bacterium]|nr:hypothetical protein [Anaerolineae bacterium]